MTPRWIVRYEGEPGWCILSAPTTAAAVEKYVTEDADCPHDLVAGVVVCIRPEAGEVADWSRYRVSRATSPLQVEPFGAEQSA